MAPESQTTRHILARTGPVPVPEVAPPEGPRDLLTSVARALDVLEAVAQGSGPQKMLVTLGYSGWGAGQLEGEIAANAWLTVGANPQILFDTPADERYDAALKLLGVDPTQLSGLAGHA